MAYISDVLKKKLLYIYGCEYMKLGLYSMMQVKFYIPSWKMKGATFKSDMLANKYDFVIMDWRSDLLEVLSLIMEDKKWESCKTRVIIVSNMRWPVAENPMKLSDNVYFVESKGVVLLLKNNYRFRQNDYLKDHIINQLTVSEKNILRLKDNGVRNEVICKLLKIEKKTLSSHVSNIKKKMSAKSYQHIAQAYKLKYLLLKGSDAQWNENSL
ncbi:MULTISPECIES: LuxR C-terminal-related transcriptional regulator [Enterobacter]